MSEKVKMPMPDGYMPKKRLPYMALYFEHAEGVQALSDEQAGKLLKRLFALGQSFADSYDDGLCVDTSELEPLAAYVAKQMAGSLKRAAQGWRESSYNRSGANGGGRPSKT